MPTAGRLAAAIAFFIYGWYHALAATPFFAEGIAPTFLLPLSIIVSILCGWRVVGSRVGGGYVNAVGHGLTGAFAYSIWMIFLISFEEMVSRSLRLLYDGPMEALVGVFDLMLRLSIRMADLNLILSVAIGGIICGLFSEFFAKRYP